MDTSPDLISRETLNKIKIYDPLSSEKSAIRMLRDIGNKDGGVSGKKLINQIRRAIASYPIHRASPDDSPLDMSLRAKARNQRRMLHLIQNFLYGNLYKSVEEKTDWSGAQLKKNFRVNFFRIFGLKLHLVKGEFCFDNNSQISHEIERICSFYQKYWDNWIDGIEMPVETTSTETTSETSE